MWTLDSLYRLTGWRWMHSASHPKKKKKKQRTSAVCLIFIRSFAASQNRIFIIITII